MAKNLKILFPALAAALLSACAGGALKSDLVELRAAALQA
jgi:hypothetical protein